MLRQITRPWAFFCQNKHSQNASLKLLKHYVFIEGNSYREFASSLYDIKNLLPHLNDIILTICCWILDRFDAILLNASIWMNCRSEKHPADTTQQPPCKFYCANLTCLIFPAERHRDDQRGFWSESDLYEGPQIWKLQQKVLIISSLHFGKIMHKTVAGHVSKSNYLGTEIIDSIRLQCTNWSLQSNYYFTFPLRKEKSFLYCWMTIKHIILISSSNSEW